MTKETAWYDKVKAKKDSVIQLIPDEWIIPKAFAAEYTIESGKSVLNVPEMFLSPKELEITNAGTAVSLLEDIASGKYASVEVVNAFAHRTATATQLTNCCTEIMFEFALKRAEFLDDYLKTHGTVYGPLHGLPISMKDSFKFPGVDSTLGFVDFIGNGKNIKDFSPLVKQLLDLGAIPFVKSNIPQTLMTADSENNIFGRTLNPNNLSLTAGGSSGGEGSLVKQRGSLLGIGTDVAGSIRIPSLCCGVYGFKPTSNRVPYSDQISPPGSNPYAIPACAGPLANSWKDIELFFKCIFSNSVTTYDSSVLPFGFNKETAVPQILKVAVVLNVDYFPVHPTMQNLIEKAANDIKNAGHEVTFLPLEEINFYQMALETCYRFYQSSEPGAVSPLSAIEAAGEPKIKSLSMDAGVAAPTSVEDYYATLKNRKIIKERLLKIFETYDVILTPGNAGTAPLHDEYGIPPFTCIWNLVDFPAAIIPYDVVTEDYDDDSSHYPEELIARHSYPIYKKNVHINSPGHVQIVAPQFLDEKLLAIGNIIDGILNQKQ